MAERGAHARSLSEALETCALHGRGGLAEALRALRAGVDAASFVWFGCAADESPLDPFWLLLDELSATLQTPTPEGGALIRALSEALDEESERWAQRGRDDPQARAVSRAFAELRALLREFAAPDAGPRRATSHRGRRSPRGAHRGGAQSL